MEMEKKSANIVWHQHKINKQSREESLGQKGILLWFTGLSGSGKSTIASALEQKLWALGKHTYLLDGDNIRHGLNGDLGFSDEDRKENIRRIKEVAKLFVDAGTITIASFIAPFKEDRASVRKVLGQNFIEVFIDCPLEVCQQRDPKGLYKKVEMGEIKNFTGIDSPYEKPDQPEIIIQSNQLSVEESVDTIIEKLKPYF
ncbi:adenylylsulfate kinase [Natranaerovirga hydrolytica]|uniref:Adenylyl-sulfate kinase n=1 Tax=Natranaerovirga hydrolytica TaxID=680378 RepID=A0A4R1MIF3_9FIRM|nr:adenylylsulfate kinase [Natranaerovirga hydrolytica]